MNFREREMLGLIGSLYDASVDPHLWTLFLEKLSQILHNSVCSFIVLDTASHSESLQLAVGLDPHYLKLYNDYYYSKNLWIHGSDYKPEPGLVEVSESLVPDNVLLKSEFYADWLRPADLRHLVGGLLRIEGSVIAFISALRSRGGGAFSQEDASTLKWLMPHLQRTIQIQERLKTVQKGRDATIEALERVPVGILLLTDTGNIQFANASAERIVNQMDGLRSQHGALSAKESGENSTLRALIQSAAKTTEGKGFHPGGSMRISRPSGKRALSLLIAPLSRDQYRAGQKQMHVIAFLSDPEKTPQPTGESLQRDYGLTPSETRFVDCLLSGTSVGETAQELDITYNTARSVLKTVFQKTGTNRQSELMRTLLTHQH